MDHDGSRSASGLTLRQFSQCVAIIEGSGADRIREEYIAEFVDTTSDYYIHQIADHGFQGDEVCYTGYLWDTLKDSLVITEEQVLARLARPRTIYTFWDLHNAKKIRIDNYWKFPLKAVLRLSSSDLVAAVLHDSNVEHVEDWILPEDIYTFDESLEWTLVLTHERTEDGERFCLEAR